LAIRPSPYSSQWYPTLEPLKSAISMVEEIEISQNDKRLYRYLTLPNGLHALLISDPETSVLESDHAEEVEEYNDGEDFGASGSESEGEVDFP